MPQARTITMESANDLLRQLGADESHEHDSPVPAQQNGAATTFDVVAFLESNGVVIERTEQHGGDVKYVLAACVFNPEHKAPDAAVFVKATGQLGYKCFHDSCTGKGWRDVRQYLDPGCYDRKPLVQTEPRSDSPTKPVCYERLTSAELADGDFRIEYLIEDVLVAGQPGIISGRFKTLKTTIAIDAAVSMATATPFLGHFGVANPVSVGIMSGESGKATLQETATRICAARDIDLRKVERLTWSTTLPRIGDAKHSEALQKFIEADDLATLFIDPSYLAMSGIGDDAGNLFKVGCLLVSLTEIGQATGCSIVLCCHNKRAKSYDVPELADVAWAGTSEWARQWLLLNQRAAWDPDHGRHWLWLAAGGSAGHGCVVGLDITEGRRSDPGGRRWEVNVVSAPEARERHREAQQENKRAAADSDREAQLEADMRTVVDLLRNHASGETTKAIRELTGLSTRRCGPALESLLRDGQLEDTTITRTNGQQYPGYRLKDE